MWRRPLILFICICTLQLLISGCGGSNSPFVRLPLLLINNQQLVEGDDGLKAMIFTARLSAASRETITVAYATANGTATADADYQAASGTLTFAPGEKAKSISVEILGDLANEDNETFEVNLSEATNATISQGKGVGVIIDDDDPLPGLFIDDPRLIEGDAGRQAMVFTVSLTATSRKTITVAYATANGTATAGADYQAASGTLTFAPTETKKNVSVQILGDVADEDNETFEVNLSEATNATISQGKGVGVILDDDDPLPGLFIDDPRLIEGDVGRQAMVFTVSLTAASRKTITVAYATANGTATAGADYLAASGTLTFAPGETKKNVSVQILGDVADEEHETFKVALSKPVLATIQKGVGVGTILDNDPLARVLLIGDSISLGYRDAARVALANVALVEHIGRNTDSTVFGLARLPGWLGDASWEVIHFNFGLHDIEVDDEGNLAVPLAQYEQNLRDIIRLLRQRKPGARLIWASTTPVPAGYRFRRNADVLRYNAAAARIMANEGIPIDDLYSAMAANLERYQQPRDVHFLPAGNDEMARVLAASVRAVLGLE